MAFEEGRTLGNEATAFSRKGESERDQGDVFLLSSKAFRSAVSVICEVSPVLPKASAAFLRTHSESSLKAFVK